MPEPICNPQVLQALRAELHKYPGGHQTAVQESIASLTTEAARCILNILRGQEMKISRMRRDTRTLRRLQDLL